MQLICKKKELLEIKEESPLLTFYYSNQFFRKNILPSRIKTYLCIRNEFHFVKTLNANYYGYQSNHGFS